jgi:hypothetical protein
MQSFTLNLIAPELASGMSDEEFLKSIFGERSIADEEAFKVIKDWFSGGAETYCMYLGADVEGEPRQFVLKSFITFPTAPAKTLEIWNQKRALFSGRGVDVPRLLCAAGATLLEELIPFSIEEIRIGRTELVAAKHLRDVLIDLEFEPLMVYEDLRSRGAGVVLVDFGSDLGMPTGRKGASQVKNFELFNRWLSNTENKNE